MSTLIEQIEARQNQFLEMAEAWQKPVINVINRATSAVESRAPKLPKLPTLPFLSDLPKPSELFQIQYDFAAKLIENNKKFVLELAEALEGLAPEAEKDEAESAK